MASSLQGKLRSDRGELLKVTGDETEPLISSQNSHKHRRDEMARLGSAAGCLLEPTSRLWLRQLPVSTAGPGWQGAAGAWRPLPVPHLIWELWSQNN